MPFELVGFVARVGVEAAYHVILAVGAGEDRKAAIVRSIIFAALVMLLAKLLHWLLIADQSVTALDLFVALPTTLIGGYLAVRCVGDIVRLRHWGEPELAASATGLTMPRRNRVIRWEDIVAVTPQRRGRRRRVRVDVSGAAGNAVFIPTTRPEALAATILAERKEWEPRS